MGARALAKAIASALARQLGGVGAGAPAWSPSSLFASGEQGVWYDPSDFSTMFQDSAGTTPVTAVGQPVGKILDKSGRGNHASQSTAAARPVLQQDGNGKYYLAFDGVDDRLQTVSSVDLSANDSVLSIVGISKDTDSGVGHVVAFGDTTLPNDGSFFIAAPVFSAPTAGFYSRGTALSANNYNDASIAAPWLGVCTGIGDISADQLIFRTNGVQRFNTASDQGSGNYGVWPLHIGNIPTYPFFQGRMYSILIRGGTSTAQEVSDAEAYAASKTGVTL